MLTDIYTRGLESIRKRRENEAAASGGLQNSMATDISDASPYVSPTLTGANEGMQGAGALDGAALLNPGDMDLYGGGGAMNLGSHSAADSSGAIDYISGLHVGKLLSEQQAQQELLRQHGSVGDLGDGMGYGNGGNGGGGGGDGASGAVLRDGSTGDHGFDDSKQEAGSESLGEILVKELLRTVNCHWEGDAIVMNEFGIRVLPPYTAYDCHFIGSENNTFALERAQKIVQGCRAKIGL